MKQESESLLGHARLADLTPYSAQTGAIKATQVLLILLLLAVLGGGAAVLTGFWPDSAEETKPAPVSQPITPAVTPPETPAPQPEAAAVQVEITTEPAPPPLPDLSQSDDPVRDAVADIPLGTVGQEFLTPGNVIERSSSLIYLLAQGDVPYKLLPIARPKEAFPFIDDGTQVITDPAGFARYDGLAQWIGSLDAGAIVSALQPLLPLFREAWSFYGEDASDFDFAVLTVLETLISTPEPREVRLVRKEAVWVYEDPELEALPAIQKQIMRMGPDNADIVRAKALEFRRAWMEQSLPD